MDFGGAYVESKNLLLDNDPLGINGEILAPYISIDNNFFEQTTIFLFFSYTKLSTTNIRHVPTNKLVV